MKHKTKIQMMWEVGKEAEKKFREELNLCFDMDKEYLDEVFKLIRGTEYRRGKEDALMSGSTNKKEFLNE